MQRNRRRDVTLSMLFIDVNSDATHVGICALIFEDAVQSEPAKLFFVVLVWSFIVLLRCRIAVLEQE